MVFFGKEIAEMRGCIEGQGIGNVGDAVVGSEQKRSGVVQLLVHNVFVEGHSGCLFDHAIDVVGMVGKFTCDGIVLNVLGDVRVYVAHDLGGGVGERLFIDIHSVSEGIEQNGLQI